MRANEAAPYRLATALFMIRGARVHLLRGGRSLGALHEAQKNEFAQFPGAWVDLRARMRRQNVVSGWYF